MPNGWTTLCVGLLLRLTHARPWSSKQSLKLRHTKEGNCCETACQETDLAACCGACAPIQLRSSLQAPKDILRLVLASSGTHIAELLLEAGHVLSEGDHVESLRSIKGKPGKLKLQKSWHCPFALESFWGCYDITTIVKSLNGAGCLHDWHTQTRALSIPKSSDFVCGKNRGKNQCGKPKNLCSQHACSPYQVTLQQCTPPNIFIIRQPRPAAYIQ